MAYATTTDLTNLGLRAAAQAGLSSDSKTAALDAASDEIDSYLAKRFRLPLLTWGNDLRKHCVNIAVYDLLSQRGFSAGVGEAEHIRLRYDDSISWLTRVAKGIVTPQYVDDGGGDSTAVSTSPRVVQYRQDDTTGEFRVTTSRTRGW